MLKYGIISKDASGDIIPLKNISVNVYIHDYFSRTKVLQTYTNISDKMLSANYIFSIYTNCLFDTLTVYYQLGNILHGIMIEKKLDYNSNKHDKHDKNINKFSNAYLLNKINDTTYLIEIGNLDPNETIRIEYTYISLVRLEMDYYKYIFPIINIPKYISPIEKIDYNSYITFYPFTFNLHIDWSTTNKIEIINSNISDSITEISENRKIIMIDTIPHDRDIIVNMKSNYTKPNIYKYTFRDHNYFAIINETNMENVILTYMDKDKNILESESYSYSDKYYIGYSKILTSLNPELVIINYNNSYSNEKIENIIYLNEYNNIDCEYIHKFFCIESIKNKKNIEKYELTKLFLEYNILADYTTLLLIDNTEILPINELLEKISIEIPQYNLLDEKGSNISPGYFTSNESKMQLITQVTKFTTNIRDNLNNVFLTAKKSLENAKIPNTKNINDTFINIKSKFTNIKYPILKTSTKTTNDLLDYLKYDGSFELSNEEKILLLINATDKDILKLMNINGVSKEIAFHELILEYMEHDTSGKYNLIINKTKSYIDKLNKKLKKYNIIDTIKKITKIN